MNKIIFFKTLEDLVEFPCPRCKLAAAKRLTLNLVPLNPYKEFSEYIIRVTAICLTCSALVKRFPLQIPELAEKIGRKIREIETCV